MRLESSLQQAEAYEPMRTIVEDILNEAAEENHELRPLLLKSAVLRDFDAGLLSRLAGRQEEDRRLLDYVTFFMPVEKKRRDETKFYYDRFYRQALLELASKQGEQIIEKAAQEAADYHREQAQKDEDATRRREHERDALYYQLWADPKKGYDAWLEAWVAVSREHADFKRQAELLLDAEEAWDPLAKVPGAQVNVLLKKGWLAFDLDDWQRAKDIFWKLLAKDEDEALERRAYLRMPFASYLVDGEQHPEIESEANVGLGYTYFRQGALGSAAEHFEKARRLVGKQPDGQSHAAKVRSRALCGLGEVCARMGTPEDALLLHLLLPEEERRETQLQHAQSRGTWSLEELALYRLQMEAEKFLADALEAIADHKSADSDRLRIHALQAQLYSEQGDWQGARASSEEVRQQELARLGVDSERTALEKHRDLLAQKPRITERLARINLCLGDWWLLVAETPVKGEELQPEQTTHWQQRLVRLQDKLLEQASEQLKDELLKRVDKRGQTESDLKIEGVSGEIAQSKARRYYNTAWELWKSINMREGMALALRRQADMAALHLDEPDRRDRALRRYKASLELYEQIGDPGAIARAQERIQLLLDRTQPPEKGRLPVHEPAVYEKSTVAKERAAKKRKNTRKGSSLEEFREAVEKVLAHRRRFFHYRVAQKLERRLWRVHRVNSALGGLALTAVLCGWLVYLAVPWMGQISARVTSLSWALPILGVSLIAAFMILVAERSLRVRRLTVRLIPRSWFWFNQEQIAVDDVGLQLYDHTGQRKELIRWQEVWQVRSQFWKEQEGEQERGGRTAVFGALHFDSSLRGYRRLLKIIKNYITGNDQVIRFDDSLRGYWRLLQIIKDHIEKTGDPERWREPKQTFIRIGRSNFVLWLCVVLLVANGLAWLLTSVFILFPALSPFGPPTFQLEAILVVLFGLWIVVQRYRESRFMRPYRKSQRR